MRVLLDECLPRKLKNDLSGHDVRTVPEMGWAGKKNGELLQLAAQHLFTSGSLPWWHVATGLATYNPSCPRFSLSYHEPSQVKSSV
jgi:hypothetical protein